MGLKKVTLPHKLRYSTGEQSPLYKELFILFVSSYLAMLKTAKSAQKSIMTKHLKDLMADAELYDWEPVRAYLAVWLQQIENGRVNWNDSEAKLEFHHALVWHPAQLEVKPERVASAAALKKPAKN